MIVLVVGWLLRKNVHVCIGISRGQAKPRGSRVRVPAGTGAGRPGNTPNPSIPDPCIRPMSHKPVAACLFTVQLSRPPPHPLRPPHPPHPLFGADDSHEGQRRPTAANEGQRRGKRKPTKR